MKTREARAVQKRNLFTVEPRFGGRERKRNPWPGTQPCPNRDTRSEGSRTPLQKWGLNDLALPRTHKTT